ncbi:MAG: nucleoid occlusion factor SlmA, partial [Burkholderiaceae bacterium]|nr:nucleoid occlusion factor SlmA [Burkholderiaceae bacterium]
YRHFASKAQMFEGLIEFIETTIFGLINEIETKEASGIKQVGRMVRMLLEFATTNRGMTRVLIGDALVNEHERLQERMNQLLERIESSLRQGFRVAVSQQEVPAALDANAQAALTVAYVIGRWHRFAKSGFRKLPAEGLEAQLPTLLA